MERGRRVTAAARGARADRAARAGADPRWRDHSRPAPGYGRRRVQLPRQLGSASMSRVRLRTAALACASLGLVQCAATARAVSPPAPAAPPPALTPASAPPSPPRVQLSVQRARGNPPFALIGQRIIVLGAVAPYVAAQT